MKVYLLGGCGGRSPPHVLINFAMATASYSCERHLNSTYFKTDPDYIRVLYASVTRKSATSSSTRRATDERDAPVPNLSFLDNEEQAATKTKPQP